MLNFIKDNLIKILSFVLVTLLCIVLILFGVIWVLEKGPSPTATASFCKSTRETSALRWVPGVFLSDEEVEKLKSEDTSATETEDVDTTLISISEINTATNVNPIEIVDIYSGSSQGKMMIIKDPKRVILGTSNAFKEEPGLLLSDMIKKYDGIAGINAGGFKDQNGQGTGGIPEGLVITEGEIINGSETREYSVVGLDENGILIVGNMKGTEALEKGIIWGVSFKTHDGLASSLIINGEVQSRNLTGGVNPRTAIGQRADGALLMLVLDGRSINTLGATLDDVVNIMLEYGAVNAGNLDGGSSSIMIYDGEIINNCSSITGPRKIPTGFIVLKEEGD